MALTIKKVILSTLTAAAIMLSLATIFHYSSVIISAEDNVRLTEYLNRDTVAMIRQAKNAGNEFPHYFRACSAIRNGNSVFISRRFLATEPRDIGFNIYRVIENTTVKQN